MTDREFLIWLHERFEHKYKEHNCYDFMHRLRNLIIVTPNERITPIQQTFNSLEDMQEFLNKQETSNEKKKQL